ncbi:hypothetical protein [Olivibacter sitiensis]|uniref:hypothetical protein n=1 Tax=Olivibacter sitiensis TaxID=376470 RepID=UPI00040CA12D|nr:hypothetical protein [Olivibacter sitiensis]
MTNKEEEDKKTITKEISLNFIRNSPLNQLNKRYSFSLSFDQIKTTEYDKEISDYRDCNNKMNQEYNECKNPFEISRVKDKLEEYNKLNKKIILADFKKKQWAYSLDKAYQECERKIGQGTSISFAGSNLPSLGYYSLISVREENAEGRTETDKIATVHYKKLIDDKWGNVEFDIRINPLANNDSESISKNKIFTGLGPKKRDINNYKNWREKL